MITEKEIYSEMCYTAVLDTCPKFRLNPRISLIHRSIEDEMLMCLFILQEMPFIELSYCPFWDEIIATVKKKEVPESVRTYVYKKLYKEMLEELDTLKYAINDLIQG